MVEGSSGVGRAAVVGDVPAVAACLMSAFYDDPVWGRWTFPDPKDRAQRLYRLMQFWASSAVRHPWVRMTDDAEAVAVWLPPGEPEMTTEEGVEFGALVSDLLGARAPEVNTLFELFDEHHPEASHYYEALGFRRRSEFGPEGGPAITTMWREAR